MADSLDGDELLDRAIDWVVLLRSGRATHADAERLRRWRALGPEHERAFIQAARLYRDLGTMGHELEQGNRRSIGSGAPAGRRLIHRRALIGGALAASAAGVMLVRPPLEMWPSLAEMSADYRTAKGEQLDVTLANKVALKLNTQTSIAVRGDAGSRIELISGEAAITSGRPASDPLIILAADGQITSMVGELNLRCIDGAVLATCIEGAATVTQGGRSVQLQKGEQVGYADTQPLGQPSPVSDPDSLSSWRQKLLIFKDKPLAAVVGEINRYRAGRIVIANADLGRRLVNGTFHTDKLDDFVAQVEQLYAVKARSLPGGIVFLS